MSTTDIGVVANQIQKFWAPIFTKELREQTLLPGLVSKDYQGEIKQQGDTVYVSQINAPTGSLKTIGTDPSTFDSEQLSTTRISIAANKRAVAAFEFDDLSQLQSQIGAQDSEIRNALKFAVEKQLNDYLYSLVAPGSGLALTSKSTMDAAQIIAIRTLAAQKKWDNLKPWYLLVDPGYNSDILSAATLTSRDYVDGDTPVVAGQVATKRFNFNILEDNSRPGNSHTAGQKFGLAFHPDFLCLCMQQEVRFKLSDLHSQKKFGYVLSVDMIFGAGLGVSGASKHISVKS
jgi:hypothetical protein